MNSETKRHIDAARQVLVGVVPNPTSQIEQITNALIYKFMDDMDQSAIKAGGEPAFFVADLEKYSWTKMMNPRIGNQERMNIYAEALVRFSQAKQLPELFRDIFKSAFLPYRSPETLGLFLKEINYFDYSHPEELGNAYEYLLSIMSSQGDAGQFRTPRHIIDFIVDVVNPTKDDKVLDPACGTAGFLISSYRHILEQHDSKNDPDKKEKPLTPDDRKVLMSNFEGYDIDPTMVRIAQVNMYLHQFKNPKIYQYDSLSRDEKWNDKFDVILANPPFMSPKGGIKPHNKFSIHSNRSEVLFVDYIINHLRPNGRAGIIVPEGIIFQSGNAHRQLRKNLVNDGLYAVVSLPSGVFAPYSGVKTSILLFDNEFVKTKNEILFVEIKDTGISLGATQHPIDKNDLLPARSIIQLFQRGQSIKPTGFAFTVEKDEIRNSNYDLSSSKYRKRIVISYEISFQKLGDICSITKGKSSSTKTSSGPYQLYLTAETQKTSDHFDFEGVGVAVPLISATGHGKAAIKRVHFVTGRFALANLLAFIEPKDTEKISPKYLYWILNNSKEEMARLMRGAANVSMKTSDLEAFQIPVPSIQTQEQIVKDLDRYSSIVAGARQIIFNWNPRVDVDPQWEKARLDEIVEILDSKRKPITKTDRVAGPYPYYGATGILDHVAKYIFDERLILLGEDGAKWESGDQTAFIAEGKYWVNNHAHVLRPKPEKIIDVFLVTYLNQLDLSSYITGVTVPKLNQEKMRSIEIPLPDLKIQRQIVEKIEAERESVESAKKLIRIYEDKTKSALEKLYGHDN